MFSTKMSRFFKPVGAARFLIGVAALLTMAAPALGQTFAYGQYCTFTQGGWGAVPKGNNPGMILKNNFSIVYSSGVEVGIPGTTGFSMQFTSPDAVMNYLPAGGKPHALTADLLNPTSSPSGVFGGQVLALQLNVDFSTVGILPAGFGSLTLSGTGTAFDGMMLSDILAAANLALGGGSLLDSTLNDLVSLLNQGFDNCYPSGWVQDHLTPSSGGGDDGGGGPGIG